MTTLPLEVHNPLDLAIALERLSELDLEALHTLTGLEIRRREAVHDGERLACFPEFYRGSRRQLAEEERRAQEAIAALQAARVTSLEPYLRAVR